MDLIKHENDIMIGLGLKEFKRERNNMNKLEFTKDQKDKIISEIQNYFLSERDENIGELQASILMDFFVDLIGKASYNQGVEDVKRYMEEKLDDLYGMTF